MTEIQHCMYIFLLSKIHAARRFFRVITSINFNQDVPSCLSYEGSVNEDNDNRGFYFWLVNVTYQWDWLPWSTLSICCNQLHPSWTGILWKGSWLPSRLQKRKYILLSQACAWRQQPAVIKDLKINKLHYVIIRIRNTFIVSIKGKANQRKVANFSKFIADDRQATFFWPCLEETTHDIPSSNSP